MIRWCIFENAVGEAFAISGIHYRQIIIEYLWLKLNKINLEDIWLQ